MRRKALTRVSPRGHACGARRPAAPGHGTGHPAGLWHARHTCRAGRPA